MPLCSRDSIPACAVCDQPTMEAGTDDRPWAESWSDGFVCSEACELRDILAHANPDADHLAILDAAHRLGRDYASLTTVRLHRAACLPVEGVPTDYREEPAPEVLLEDDDGDQRCVLLGMVERVEVVEDA